MLNRILDAWDWLWRSVVILLIVAVTVVLAAVAAVVAAVAHFYDTMLQVLPDAAAAIFRKREW